MMENVYEAYLSLFSDYMSENNEVIALEKIDRYIAQVLYNTGYGTNATLTALMNFSPYAKRFSSADRFAEYQKKILPGEKEDDMDFLQVSSETFFDIYNQFDLTPVAKIYGAWDYEILNELLNIGFAWDEVKTMFMAKSKFFEIAKDKALQSDYVSSIINKLELDREGKSIEEYADAEKAYLERITMSEKKYAGNSAEFNIFREGSIVLPLLLINNFSQETVRQVLRKHTLYVGEDKEKYISDLIKRCMQIKFAYLKIEKAGNFSAARNEIDVYRFFARKYMKRNKLQILDYTDDAKILSAMREAKLPEHYLKNAFLNASPVALEPGRSKESYVQTLLEENHKENLLYKESSRASEAEVIYLSEITKYDTELKANGVTQGTSEHRFYYDCLAAYKMVIKNFAFPDILQVLKNHMPQKTDSYRESAAEIILYKVEEIIKKEQDLVSGIKNRLSLEEMKNKSYKQLTEVERYSPMELFKNILHEHFQLNPSLKHRLLEPVTNLMLTESILFYFPDFDREALAGILSDTPYGIVLANSDLPEAKRYEENVISQVEERLKEHNEYEKYYNSIVYDFNKQLGLSLQGVSKSMKNPGFTAFQYGQTALKLMNKGTPLHEIRAVIIQTVFPMDSINKPPEKFADDIIEKTKQVYNRIQAIKTYIPGQKPATPSEYYINKIFEAYKGRGSVKPSIDADIAKDMLLHGFLDGEVAAAIQEVSPSAVQPGRDESYSKYVIDSAKDLITTEKNKLARIETVSIDKPAEDLKETYKLYIRKLQGMASLPFDMHMDEIIIRSMLLAGTEVEQLEKLIQEESPCKELSTAYGESLVRRINSDIIKNRQEDNTRDSSDIHEKDHTKENSRSRGRERELSLFGGAAAAASQTDNPS